MRSTNNARRGRPAESTENGELNRRRERGRLAQQAFRQRQVDAIATLEGEVASLKSSLSDIGSLVQKLNGSLLAAQMTANITAADLSVRQAMDLLLERVRDATQDPGEKGDAILPAGKDSSTMLITMLSRTEQTSTPTLFAISPSDEAQAHPNSSNSELLAFDAAENDPYDQEMSFSGSTSMFQPSPKGSSSSGRLSPRFDYGLWFEPNLGLPIVVPPEDIIPFLTDVESPFVLKLYWSTMSLAFSVLRDHWRRRAGTLSNTTILAQRIFGTSLQYDSAEVIAASIDARLGFRFRGQIEATHPGRDPSKAPRLYHKIQAGLRMRGETMQNWLTAKEVERLIGNLYGLDQVMLLQAACRETADAYIAQTVNQFVESLARQSVCFGDGPRYPADRVAPTMQLVLGGMFEEGKPFDAVG